MDQQEVIKAQLSTLKKRTSSRRSFGTTILESKDEEPSAPAPPAVEVENVLTVEKGSRIGGMHVTEAELHPVDVVKCAVLDKSVPIIKWACQECRNECIPVMRESRCLCGHRMKEHKLNPKDNKTFPCASKGCRCNHFFYLVAEGAWILRCRCKHKHTDHECGPGAHKCLKCAACAGFDSPWVCNCGHTWSAHKQRTVVITESNIIDELGPEPAARKQHFYRQDGLDDHK